MKPRIGRRALCVVGALVAVPLVAASIAYACTALATLSLNPASGDAGAQVSGSGRAFSSAPTAEPVVVRFNSRSGPVLWTGRPDGAGNINFTFAVPNVAPGSYAVIATQNNADGHPVGGTPARAAFTVTGQRVVQSPAPPAPGQPQATSAPATRPAGQAIGGAAPAAAPAPALAGQPGSVPGSAVAPGAAPGTQGGPPSATGAATGTAAVPGAAPAPFGAPAAEERRTVLGADSNGPGALPLALVAAGLVLTLVATGFVVASRREEKALAWTRR